jgi:hypothetical protein
MNTQAIAASIASRDLAPPPVLWPERSALGPGGWRRHAVIVTAVALLTGGAWMSVIPPFEGTDELHFYNRAREYAARPERREGLFFRLAAPIVRVMKQPTGVVAPEYNPAFQFVSNARGEMNRFVHDRPVAPREHVRLLMAIRGLVVALAVVTALMIYAMARLSLGDGRLALLVAGMCLWIPQSSFANATVHAEALTRLIAAAITLAIVARVTGRLPRALAWVLLPIGIALVPFADRQALFLAPFAAIGLVATERTWRARAVAALLVAAPAAVAFWIVTRFTEQGTDIGPWLLLLKHPLRPLFEADPARGSFPPDAPYYAFEFVPKLFMGFWGWMGQPSILLPAWTYAALAVFTGVSLIGLVRRLRHPAPASDEARRRQAARRLLAVGIGLMCLPIVYGPAIAGRNLWYGRWLFAMIGPIVIGLVLGFGEFILVARRWPHRTAIALGVVALGASSLWLAGPGEALRAGIMVNHYGDRARLIVTARDIIAVTAIAAVAIELAAHAPPWPTGIPAIPALIAVIAVMNAIAVAGFIRPLYAPLTADEYVALVSKYMAAHDLARASDVYASAIKSYPGSVEIRQLADDAPRLLLGGPPATSLDLLWNRLARAKGLNDRDALLMLAHQVRESRWRDPDRLNAALTEAERHPELVEPVALVRLALSDGAADRDASRGLIEAGHGKRLDLAVRNGEVIFEGFTVHPVAGGGSQLILYFRPRVDSANRRLFLHAYRSVGDYVDVEPGMVPAVWRPGELAWAAFDLPAGKFTAFAGVWVGSDRGPEMRLGEIR